MTFTIAYREFRTLFLSPLAWSILAIMQFILAFLFLTQIKTFIAFQTQLAGMDNAPGLTDVIIEPLFSNAAIILLLVTPLLTMRLVSEEQRNKTLSLLLSAPLSGSEIIVGKFLGVWGLLLIIVLLICLMPLSLIIGGDIDDGKLFCNVLALSLLAGAFSALGLYMSCLTNLPTVAAISSFGLLLLLWIIDSNSIRSEQPLATLHYVALLKHFQNIQTGLLSSVDVVYFILFIGTFLLLSIRKLDHQRLQK